MNIFRKLAAEGARFPLATDLDFCAEPDPDAVKLDGARLGQVVAKSARRWNTPVAVPLMDLTLEKAWLAEALGIADQAGGAWHLEGDIPDDLPDTPWTPRIRATCDAIRHISENEPGMVPCGMCIGPFSLMTKLLLDPITPVFLAGMGEADEDVERIDALAPLCLDVVLRFIKAQIDAGARAMIVCEPAANTVFFSPNQLAEGADTFERFVMAPNRDLAAMLAGEGVDFILHDCGELTREMVRDLASLRPALLSLGGSQRLWEDAEFVPDEVVLYGNLPSKEFYSDETMPVEKVEEIAREIVGRMVATGHPFILGSECDVLCVHGSEQTIAAKVEAFLKV